jgi:hypothetical protein
MDGNDEPRQLGALRGSYLARPQRWVGMWVAGGAIAVIGVPLVIAIAAEGRLWVALFPLAVCALFGWMLIDKLKSARRAVNARLDLFERGAVVTTAEGPSYSFAWDSTRVQQSVVRIRQNGITETSHVYGLIREDGTAVVIGDTVTRMSGLCADVTTVVRGAAFADPQEWGPAIQHAVTHARLPADALAIERGERIVYGPLALSREAIEYKGETVLWSRMNDLRVVNGRFRARADGRRGLWMDISVSAVPNFPIVKALAGQWHSAAH